METKLEEMCDIIKNSISRKDAISKMGCSTTSGGGYRTLNRYIKMYNLDISHFHKRGPTNKRKLYKDEELFIEQCNVPRGVVKKRYLEILNNYACVSCNNNGHYNNKPLTLQMDHINGINNDNRLENLRLLCPNCHTQTTTYCSKNKVAKIKPITFIRSEWLLSRGKMWLDSQYDRIQLLNNSDIDFTKRGWVTKISVLLGIKRQKVKKWLAKKVEMESRTGVEPVSHVLQTCP